MITINGTTVTVTVTDAHFMGDDLVESAGQQWPVVPVEGDFGGATWLAEAIAACGGDDGVVVVIETDDSRERLVVAN